MAAVRSRGNTTTEIPLAKLLWASGTKGLPKTLASRRKPDFAWPGRKVAELFVDGCFWHGCSCKYLPRTNTKFWRNKIEANKRRDRRVARSLRSMGWVVIGIKECSIRKPSVLARIVKALSEG